MKVRWTPSFKEQFERDWASHQSVVNLIISKLEQAASIEELEDIVTCEADRGCCIFNMTCKVFFTYDADEVEMTEYEFKQETESFGA